MREENKFYLVILSTVVFMRIAVMLVPNIDITIFGLIIHHLWFGILVAGIGYMMRKKNKQLSLYLIAIGVGLFIDDLIFILLGGGGDVEYWALPSLVGTTLLMLFLYPLRIKTFHLVLNLTGK